jgi:acetyl-CoA carboxylase carboxyltransferase component
MIGSREPRHCVAWPSGEWGSLPLAGGIDVGHSYELKQIEKNFGVEKRKERYKELEDEYQRLLNPVRTANHFGIEEIIDPADTRSLLAAWVKHIYDVLLPQRIMDRHTGKICPIFY